MTERVVKRRRDITPEPPGGRAAERLRMFLDARRAKTGGRKPEVSAQATKPSGATKRKRGGR